MIHIHPKNRRSMNDREVNLTKGSQSKSDVVHVVQQNILPMQNSAKGSMSYLMLLTETPCNY